MKNKIILIFISFFFIIKVNGQNGSLPPVTFPSGTSLCDNTPYKLVFYDEFNGQTIDATKWNKHNNWLGCESDNWDDGRILPTGYNSIAKDENVKVGGGICNLTLRHETNFWMCNPSGLNNCGCTMTQPRQEYYSAGMLHSKYTNAFNSGRFEARMKMPIYRGAWSSFWLMAGSGVNEIDIAEAWAGNANGWPYLGSEGRPQNKYGTHAWEPRPWENPYQLQHEALDFAFPNQSWWDFFRNKSERHHQEDWHIYTCEWDQNRIKYYLDNSLVYTMWKYYQNLEMSHYEGNGIWTTYYIRTASGCNPWAGSWNVTKGYPYNNDSKCNIRLTVGNSYNTPSPVNVPLILTSLDIDYVKVWQRHPEQDGHTDLCSHPEITINGPGNICNIGQGYGLSAAAPGGQWSLSNDAVTFGGGTQGGASVLLFPNNNSLFNSVTLYYTYTPIGADPNCPPVTISKVITTGTTPTVVFCTRLHYYSSPVQNFSLWASSLGNPYPAGTTFEWDIDYGRSSSNTEHYHTFGQYVTTPSTGVDPNNAFRYYVKWVLKITNSCGTRTIQGVQNTVPYLAPMLSNPKTFMAIDTSALYLEARFTHSDSLQYRKAIYDRVGKTTVEEGTDTTEIFSLIHKIAAEELEPYLYFEDRKVETMKATTELPLLLSHQSKLYPNPVYEELYIELGTEWSKGSLQIEIHDIFGRNLMTKNINNVSNEMVTVNIRNLTEGNYIVTLKQSKHLEHYKIVKKKI